MLSMLHMLASDIPKLKRKPARRGSLPQVLATSGAATGAGRRVFAAGTLCAWRIVNGLRSVVHCPSSVVIFRTSVQMHRKGADNGSSADVA
jgi:hypothetical protein